MKKGLIIAMCCALPIAVVGLLFVFGGERVDHSSMPGWNKSQKEAFPAFSVIDIDGASISNESFKGKPAIVWFTTTWCTPCQIGAQKVAPCCSVETAHAGFAGSLTGILLGACPACIPAIAIFLPLAFNVFLSRVAPIFSLLSVFTLLLAIYKMNGFKRFAQP